MPVEHAPEVMFSIGAVLWSVLTLKLRADVNRHLPEYQRFTLRESGFFAFVRRDGILSLHRQSYPESPLRFWFWSALALILGAFAWEWLQPAARHASQR